MGGAEGLEAAVGCRESTSFGFRLLYPIYGYKKVPSSGSCEAFKDSIGFYSGARFKPIRAAKGFHDRVPFKGSLMGRIQGTFGLGIGGMTILLRLELVMRDVGPLAQVQVQISVLENFV